MQLFKRTWLGVGLVIGLAVACGSSDEPSDDDSAAGRGAGGSGFGTGGTGGDAGDGGDGNTGNTGNSPGGASTYADITSVAKMIYDAVDAGEDVSPHIEGVLEAFGVPVLADDDADGALAQIDAGLPFLTTRVAAHMAENYARGELTDVEGFVEGLAEQGVALAYPFNLGGSLDSNFLGAMLYSFTAGAESEPEMPMEAGYVLPALVHELGQERAERYATDSVDPIWGDDRLDPLQFTQLSFTVFATPAKPAQKTRSLSPASIKFRSNPGADFIKNAIKDKIKDEAEGQVTSALQDLVEVPLDKQDAAKVSVCGSLILYGHKVTMTNTPNLLWHAPKTPNLTQVDLTLTFEDDYYDNWARAVLGSAVTDLTGCAFPRKGPIEGKSIEWDVSSGLEGHGSYDITQSMTDGDGKAVASWRTVRDDYPPACQVFENQRDAVGATEAIVSGLLPGWSTVEKIVTFLNPNTGTQGDAPLTVLYYDVATDDPCHNE